MHMKRTSDASEGSFYHDDKNGTAFLFLNFKQREREKDRNDVV